MQNEVMHQTRNHQRLAISPEKSSELEKNYADLEKFLAADDWRKADQKTREIMRSLVGCSQNDWIDSADIENLSCIDLLRIDHLWTTYSNGRFGLQVQQKIWQEIGGGSNANYRVKCEFGERIGWYVDGSWLLWNKLNFSLSSPIGHLPARGFGGWLGWRVGLIDFLSTLFLHFEKCEQLQMVQSNTMRAED
jgi:hypothetical protein